MTNGNASLTGGTANWTYNLGTTATSTSLTVSDANGNVVFTAPGDTTSGNHTFTWNGKDANGNQLADGTYKLTAAATASDGSAVTTTRRQRRHRHPDRYVRRHAATGGRQHGTSDCRDVAAVAN